jgi:hypothetical protein
MECPETPDCKFDESHRYDATEASDYFRSSAIWNMAKFRQRMVDYMLENTAFLGKMPDSPVASSGRQVWPGSFGTLIPLYDFSASCPYVTKHNEYAVNLHKKSVS